MAKDRYIYWSYSVVEILDWSSFKRRKNDRQILPMKWSFVKHYSFVSKILLRPSLY